MLPISVPKVEFRGISTGCVRCVRTHVDELMYLTEEELIAVLDAVQAEVLARIGGKSKYCGRCDSREEFQNGGTLQCKCPREEPNKNARAIPVVVD